MCQNHPHHHHPKDDHGNTHDHDHHHEHDHHDHHQHSHKSIEVEQDILSGNNEMAQRVRGFLEGRNIFAINLMSSPGAGKTTILEKTIKRLKDRASICVIEGDQQTSNDAIRISKMGAKAIQINTGGGCHLEAHMIYNALKRLDPPCNSILFIENVGNLVCPAIFDLGESMKCVIISITEGEDKPLKYPAMFQHSDLCLINKIDLEPHLDFSLPKLRDNLNKINHHLSSFEMSASKELGLDEWCEFLAERCKHQHHSQNIMHEDLEYENYTMTLHQEIILSN